MVNPLLARHFVQLLTDVNKNFIPREGQSLSVAVSLFMH